MADITPDYLRGFLIPYPINNDMFWPAQSTYTQQNVRAGIPEPKQPGTGLVLSARGDQDQDLDVKTVKGGTAGTGAGFVWKGTAETDYYGVNPTSIISGADFWKFSASAPADGTYFSMDATATNTGVLLTVHENQSIGGINTIKVTRQKRGGAPSDVLLFTKQLPTYEAHPAICVLNDNSILVAHFKEATSDDITISTYRSTDEGQTFTNVSQGALAQKILTTGTAGYIPQKMRMTANDNCIILIMELLSNDAGSGAQNRIAHYVSYNKGASFTRIGISESGAVGAHEYHVPDCATLETGAFCVAYIKDTNVVIFERMPYGSFDISSSTYGLNKIEVINSGLTVAIDPGSKLTDGRLALWLDDDNVLYLAVGNVTDKSLVLFASYDDGDTWFKTGGNNSVNDATFFQPNTTGSNLYRLTATNWEGRSVLFGRHSLSIMALYLGGYATYNFPGLVTDPKFYEYTRFDNSWIPLETPQTSSFYAISGTGTETLTTTGIKILTNAGQTRLFDAAPTTTITAGHIVRFRVKITSGGLVTSDRIGVRIRIDDTTTNDYDLSVRFTTTQFRVYDNNASLTKNTTTKNMTNETEFIIAVANGNASVFFRDYDGNQAKNYTKIDITGLNNGGGGAGGYLKWGNITAPAVATESDWSEFHVVSNTLTGLQMIGSIAPNYQLYPPQGRYRYLSGGLSISCQDSPAYENDEYEILRRYDFSINRIFDSISPSPRVVWRSDKVTSGAVPAQFIPFFLDKGLQENAESKLGSDLVAVHLNNINFRNFKIKRYDVGSTSWVTMATIDTATGLTSTYVRAGNSIRFGGGGADSFYLHYNECENWRVQLVQGDTSKIRPIETNSEGTWNVNSKQAIIKLIDVDNSEPSLGSCHLIPDNVTVIISTNGANGAAWAIEIDSQETHENYVQIGAMLFGHVAVVAPQYGRGRSIQYAANTQTFETLDRQRYTRELSRGRRTAAISWTDGVDISPTQTNPPAPNYWKFSTSAGAVPVANYGDAPYMMIGLYDYLRGAKKPVVYIPAFKKSGGGAGDVILLNRYHDQLYGRTTSPVSIDHVVGNETLGNNQGEIFRISQIQIEEIE